MAFGTQGPGPCMLAGINGEILCIMHGKTCRFPACCRGMTVDTAGWNMSRCVVGVGRLIINRLMAGKTICWRSLETAGMTFTAKRCNMNPCERES